MVHKNLYSIYGGNKHDHKVNLDRRNTNFTLQLFEYLKNVKLDSEYDFLKYYQQIIRIYMNDVDIDSRGLLVNLTMGMGKSYIGIAVAMDAIEQGRQPIILLTKSLQDNMKQTIKKYIIARTKFDPNYPIGRLSPDDQEAWIKKKFSFVSMNASNMLKQMGKAAEGKTLEEFDAALESKIGEIIKIANLDNKLLIVDEAHNWFRAITNGSKNAKGLYDMVMKAKNLKLIFLTGTPMSNDPFELVPCFNMLGSKYPERTILPENYQDFYRLFVDQTTGGIKNKEKFQNRILGLVSYVSHNSTPGAAIGLQGTTSKVEFPKELTTIVEKVPMSREQYVIYQLARDKEREEGKIRGPDGRIRDIPSMEKPKSDAASSYRVRSRQLSNYCPPEKFRDADEIDVNQIPPELVTSPKMEKMYQNIQKHNNQLGIVYSQFVGVGGLGAFRKFLEFRGYKRRTIEQEKGAKKRILSNTELIEQLENMPPGEQGELDEYDPTDELDANLSNKQVGGNEYIRHIIHEAGRIKKPWWTGSDEEIPESVDTKEVESILDLIVGESIPTGVKIRVANEGDLNDLVNAFPHIKDIAGYDINSIITGKNSTIIAEYDGKMIGYAIVKYENDDITIVSVEVSTELGDVDIVKANVEILSEISKKLHSGMLHDDKFNMHVGGYDVPVIIGSAEPQSKQPAQKYYAMITGDVDVEERSALQDMFNSDVNKHGGLIDLLLLSSTGAEGLDLKNVRHIHIEEPYWNYGRIAQIKARGIRNDSHIALPEDEKNVQTYIYLSVEPEGERENGSVIEDTTDVELYEKSIKNQISIDSFHQALREVSIECMLNKEKHCRVCNPSNTELFTDDIMKDIKSADPCSEVKESQVKAQEIIVDDIKYYYSPDPNSIYDYKVYYYDKSVNGYKQMSESDPRFEKIVDAIKEAK